MKEENKLTPMPDVVVVFNGTSQRCDMLIGPCCCGAWHTLDDWKNVINNAQQYAHK